MKFRLTELELHCQKETEVIQFADFSYFHGPVGAGKTTIAKLVDFCLGGDFEPTPVLQPVFNAALLKLEICGRQLVLHRERGSDRVRASWVEGNDPIELLLPTRGSAQSSLLPGAEVEVLSDLLFHLAGVKPPRVRRSKVKEDSDLVRLSMRDLLWYCYLDQDEMDSSFFNLDETANPFKRLKSLDVLRFVVGYHQEKVSELEAELVKVRDDRVKYEAAASAIQEALAESRSQVIDIGTETVQVQSDLESARAKLADARRTAEQTRGHSVGGLQEKGRLYAKEIAQGTAALAELDASIQRDKNYRNTLRGLVVRHRRSQAAHVELSGLGFESCPHCMRILPHRTEDSCPVCGVPNSTPAGDDRDFELADADARSRVDELDDRIHRQEVAARRIRLELQDWEDAKGQIDYDLNEAMKNYDSAYLSTSLSLEQEQARLGQRLVDLKQLKTLVDRVGQSRDKANELVGREAQLRAQLKVERALAEKDRTNLDALEELFLECLLRAKLPGISPDDAVKIKPPHFLPEVEGKDAGNMVTTSFANISSGGKKNLFKCCFAVAVHRLATRNGVALPQLLFIDSPMKNISERVNREQFEGFNRMLHELAEGELQATQFIVIDKEFVAPAIPFRRALTVRLMDPTDPDNPPLLRSHLTPPAAIAKPAVAPEVGDDPNPTEEPDPGDKS